MVYFLERDTGLVKIGRTNHFISRYKQLCFKYKQHLKILGIVSEEDFAECDLHRLFKDMRVQGEWFFPNKHIRKFITDHAEPYCAVKHGGQANEVFMKMDRGLAHHVKQLAEQRGVKPHELLDELLRGRIG